MHYVVVIYRGHVALCPAQELHLRGWSTQGAKRHSDASWRFVRASPPRRTSDQLGSEPAIQEPGNEILLSLPCHLRSL